MTAMNQGHNLVRVLFRLEPDSWHGVATERLWAEPVGVGRYRLRNSPFFAYDVSAEDIVFAEEQDGQLEFAGVSIRGGHSTYRLRLDPASKSLFDQYWTPIEALGCTYEEGRVLAVDVPPSTDIYTAYELMQAGEAAGAWDMEEGHCGHPVEESS